MCHSFIFLTFPLAAVVFASLYQLGLKKEFPSRPLAKISMTVYCMHPAAIWMLKDTVTYHLLLFVFVSTITTSLSYGWILLRKQG